MAECRELLAEARGGGEESMGNRGGRGGDGMGEGEEGRRREEGRGGRKRREGEEEDNGPIGISLNNLLSEIHSLQTKLPSVHHCMSKELQLFPH